MAKLPIFLSRPEFYEQANCHGVDPSLFFPERGSSSEPAKAVCRGCEVRSECLSLALESNERFGVWGGMSERERRRVRSARRNARTQKDDGAAA